MTTMAREISAKLHALANPKLVPTLMNFFKSGEGQYGHGDRFLGVKNPQVRQLHKEHRALLKPEEISSLMLSPFNEERFLGLLYVIDVYEGRHASMQSTPAAAAREIGYDLYMKLAQQGRINNWNLVDCSAPNVVGDYLCHYPSSTKRMATLLPMLSQDLWIRRIAVVATMQLIRKGHLTETLELCKKLMDMGEAHDLMHKACGWMLREVGKRDEGALTGFLDAHAGNMPRVMLRYSIERLSPSQRSAYMGMPSTTLKQAGKKRSRSSC